ncbi:MAG: PAS domain S-box protein [Candidatus Marinimicrobia bacterium]|nr:PAS domain S-box protein [Candidatus Neomarinimicrobiota bacterium]MCF7840130.1 PAS domain S-box protein [Candidatus Neomarinimicrobiota bacterium]MCF7902084.1 PAS domain S-box protein [Candidatus Neomarinimicrobiota bacterium]
MSLVPILIISVLLQFIAGIVSLTLIRVTGWNRAWVLISLANLLMAFRRFMALLNALENPGAVAGEFITESIGLVITLIMLLGISYIAPVIRKIRSGQLELSQTKAHYQALVDQATDGIVVADPEGWLVTVNPEACNMLGYSREEMLHLNLNAIFDTYRSAKGLPWRDLQIGSSILTERDLLHRDGHTVPVEISAKRLENGIIQAFMRDISQRRSAEESLRQSEVKHRQLMNSIRTPIISVKSDDTIYYCNHALASLFQKKISDLEGQPLTEVIPEINDSFSYEARRDVIERAKPKSFETWFGKRFYRANLFPAQWGLLAIVEDMTESKQMQEELAEVHRMESVGRLAGGIAHDINNLLTPIMGYSELLKRSEGLPRNARAHLDTIYQAGNRAQQLINQLLAYGRKQILRRRDVDLNEQVREMEPAIRQVLREDIVFNIKPGSIPSVVHIDPVSLRQIVLNLVSNARDAMPQSGTLTLETGVADRPMNSGNRNHLAANRYATLSITDTGVGMDEEALKHLFEPFYTTKSRSPSQGMGLSSAHGLMRQQDGDIVCTSTPNEGTTFALYLPLSATTQPDKPAPTPVKKPIRLNVLVAEDDALTRNLVRDILASRDYKIFLAVDAEEALEIVNKTNQKLDLLVTNVVMPQMNGRQLWEKLAKKHAGLRVVYISGYASQVIAQYKIPEEAIIVGKPFSIHDFLAAVDRSLNH